MLGGGYRDAMRPTRLQFSVFNTFDCLARMRVLFAFNLISSFTISELYCSGSDTVAALLVALLAVVLMDIATVSVKAVI